MGFLGDLFDDVIDITSAPVKFVARGLDNVVESDIERTVKDLSNSLKTKNN